MLGAATLAGDGWNTEASDTLRPFNLSEMVYQDEYYITSDYEDAYELSPIKPWDPDSAEEIPPEYDENLGKKLTAKGLTDGRVIWGAEIETSTDQDKANCHRFRVFNLDNLPANKSTLEEALTLVRAPTSFVVLFGSDFLLMLP